MCGMLSEFPTTCPPPPGWPILPWLAALRKRCRKERAQKKNAIVRQPVEMRAKLDAKGVLESLIEEEKAELIEKLEQAADKARIEEELAACDQLLKRLREMRQPEAVE
jgi:hypothetical protein